MSNGNATRLGRFLLYGSIALLSGCNVGREPSTSIEPANQSRMDPIHRNQSDAARNRVWVLTPEGVVLYRNAQAGRTVIPLPEWIWAGNPYGCAPDLALGPQGEAIITSDIVPSLWRIDPETLAVTVHRLVLDADLDKDLGFCALTYSSRHGTYFAASSVQGSLWSIDALLDRAQKTPLLTPMARQFN